MSYISTGFSRSSEIYKNRDLINESPFVNGNSAQNKGITYEKSDFLEKIGTIGVGLFRLGFGSNIKVTLAKDSKTLVFQETHFALFTRIQAVILAILTLPLAILLLAIGCVALDHSKSYQGMMKKYEYSINLDRFNVQIAPRARHHSIDQLNFKQDLATPKHAVETFNPVFAPIDLRALDLDLDANHAKEGEYYQVRNLKTNRKNPTFKIGCSEYIIFNRDEGKYVFCTKAPPIKNLVISGGGAKGVILFGVLKAFEDHKVSGLSFREQLDNIAGSSVGAITASLFASGMTADVLAESSKNEDFTKLLGTGYGPINKDGKPLVNYLRQSMKEAIRDRLELQFGDLSNVEVEANDILAENEADIENIKKVMEFINSKDDQEMEITFAMLRSLHHMDPHGFKDLTVTATCREAGQIFYCDADKTPNLDIPTACRASGSLPILLSPVYIDRKSLLPGYPCEDIRGTHLSFVDGGYLDNIPVSTMEGKQEESITNRGDVGQNLQTLALVFDHTREDEESQSLFHEVETEENILFQTSKISRFIFNKIISTVCKINTMDSYTHETNKRLEEIRLDYTHRSIPLLINLGTVEFEKAKEHEDEYISSGYDQATEYLENHKNEGMFITFDSWKDLMEKVPASVKDEINNQIAQNRIDASWALL